MGELRETKRGILSLLTRDMASLRPGRQGERGQQNRRGALPAEAVAVGRGDLTWRRLETTLPLHPPGSPAALLMDNAQTPATHPKAALPPGTEQDRGWV